MNFPKFALQSFVVSALVAALLSGCAWKIIPPEKVSQPVIVHVTEYGRHTRLAMPKADEPGFWEYGFGEWNYYGLERRGLWDAIRAMTGLGQGAFSRRALPSRADGSFDLRAARGTRSAKIAVEASRVSALRQKLEDRWRRNVSHVVIRKWDSVPVSRDFESYHVFNNSNMATARWLKHLGCEIRGLPILSNFYVSSEQ